MLRVALKEALYAVEYLQGRIKVLEGGDSPHRGPTKCVVTMTLICGDE